MRKVTERRSASETRPSPRVRACPTPYSDPKLMLRTWQRAVASASPLSVAKFLQVSASAERSLAKTASCSKGTSPCVLPRVARPACARGYLHLLRGSQNNRSSQIVRRVQLLASCYISSSPDDGNVRRLREAPPPGRLFEMVLDVLRDSLEPQARVHERTPQRLWQLLRLEAVEDRLRAFASENPGKVALSSSLMLP